jgi:chromosome segregation ATPase
MACEPRSSEPLTPHEKRRLGTEQRLRTALERLVGGRPNHRSLQGQTYRLSVSTLAREARVSRNTIYANHRSILEELTTDHQVAKRIRPAPAQKIAELGAMIEQLHQQRRQLATENAALVRRAIDAEEKLDRLRKQNAQLLNECAAAHRPIALPRRQFRN